MSERLNLTINPTEQEWEAMETPFRRQGAKDPLISELREVLYAGPAWIGKARDGGGIAADRLQEIIDAAEAKADTLDHLPEGEHRNKAHAAANEAADAAKKLLAELNFGPGERGAHQAGEHHQHNGVTV